MWIFYYGSNVYIQITIYIYLTRSIGAINDFDIMPAVPPEIKLLRYFHYVSEKSFFIDQTSQEIIY